VSGSGAPITLVGGRGSVLARAVEALARFPDDGQWVLVGGLAVFVRLGSITRPTADADTVARSQASLIGVLRANDVGLVVGGGEVQVTVGGGVVEVDVMDLSDNPLPRDVERRAFALARRFALSSARLEQVVVVESDGAVVATATIPVATAAALGALKTVSMVRRPHGNHRRRLDPTSTTSCASYARRGHGRSPAISLRATRLSPAGWRTRSSARSAATFDTRSSALRNNDRSAGARALSDEDTAATIILADEINEGLSGEPDDATPRS
jgi:hypothetical protein